MADTEISDLADGGAVADADEFFLNEAGTTKKASASQLATYVGAELFSGITGVVRSDAGTLSADTDVTDLVSAASDTLAGKIEIAIQSEMETGTDTARVVTPGRQHFHPSAAKFWVNWTGGSTTIQVSYNVDSIANTATGDADGTITTDFSGADWCGIVKTLDTTDGWDAQECQNAGFNAMAAGTFGVLCSTITDGNTAVCSLTSPNRYSVIGFGDQA